MCAVGKSDLFSAIIIGKRKCTKQATNKCNSAGPHFRMAAVSSSSSCMFSSESTCCTNLTLH